VPNFEQLKKKQNDLIRKALDGSVFLAPVSANPITSLTEFTSASAATLNANSDAVTIVTGGDLVLSVNGTSVTTTLATSDTASGVVTKLNTALTGKATASLVGSRIRIVSSTTGATSRVRVLSSTGTVSSNLGLPVGLDSYGSAAAIGLRTLPVGWDDLGWLTSDGAQFSRDISTSEVSSWGSVSPTRTDITADTSALTVTCQETKLLTIGLATGADLANITPDSQTGEVRIAKPVRPKSKSYRALSVAVDENDSGEIYIARFLPKAKVNSYAEQNFGSGDDPITWGVSMTSEKDDVLGYSEQWLFGGAGWNALLAKMGFPTS